MSTIKKIKKIRKIEDMSKKEIKGILNRMGVSLDHSNRPKEYYISLYNATKTEKYKVNRNKKTYDLETNERSEKKEKPKVNRWILMEGKQKLKEIPEQVEEENQTTGKKFNESGNKNIINLTNEEKNELIKLSQPLTEKNNDDLQLINKKLTWDEFPPIKNQSLNHLKTTVYKVNKVKKRTKSKEGIKINEEIPEEKYVIIDREGYDNAKKININTLNKDIDTYSDNNNEEINNNNANRQNDLLLNKITFQKRQQKALFTRLSYDKNEESEFPLNKTQGEKKEVNFSNDLVEIIPFDISNPEIKNAEKFYSEFKILNEEKEIENVNNLDIYSELKPSFIEIQRKQPLQEKEKEENFKEISNVKETYKEKEKEDEKEEHISEEIRNSRIKAFNLIKENDSNSSIKEQYNNNVENENNQNNTTNSLSFPDIKTTSQKEIYDEQNELNDKKILFYSKSSNNNNFIEKNEQLQQNDLVVMNQMNNEEEEQEEGKEEEEEENDEIKNEEDKEIKSFNKEKSNEIVLNTMEREYIINDSIKSNNQNGIYTPNNSNNNKSDNYYNEYDYNNQNYEPENIEEENFDNRHNQMNVDQQFPQQEVNDNYIQNQNMIEIENNNYDEENNNYDKENNNYDKENSYDQENSYDEENNNIIQSSNYNSNKNKMHCQPHQSKNLNIKKSKHIKMSNRKYRKNFSINERSIPSIPVILSIILIILILLVSDLFPNIFFSVPFPSEDNVYNVRYLLVFYLSMTLFLTIVYISKNIKSYRAIAEKDHTILKKKLVHRRQKKEKILREEYIREQIDFHRMNADEYIQNVLPILEELIYNDTYLIEEVIDGNVYWKDKFF